MNVRHAAVASAILVAIALACALPTNVRYRCDPGGGCDAVPGTTCIDGLCQPTGGGAGGGGGCVPPEDASIADCPLTAECGFWDAGCGVMVDCGWACVPGQECGVKEPMKCGFAELCTGNWCWENPLPQGNTLRGSWSLDPFHTWFVGRRGTVLFWNGERSALWPIPDGGVDLYAVHGASTDDVFAVGDLGTILHWTGAGWESEGIAGGGTTALRAVFTFGDGGALAAGSGHIYRRAASNPRPSRWSDDPIDVAPVAELVSIWALRDGLILAMSRAGEMYRLEAPSTTWTKEFTAVGGTYRALWGQDGVLFAAGSQTFYVRGQDGGWARLPDFGAGVDIRSVSGTSLESMWVVGSQVRHFDAGVFRSTLDAGSFGYGPSLSTGGYYYSVAPVSDTKMIAGGSAGLLGACCDTPGALVREISGGSRNAVYGLCGLQPGTRVFGTCESSSSTAGKTRMLERTVDARGTSWTAYDTQLGGTSRLAGCFAQNESLVWAVGNDSKYLRRNLDGTWAPGDFGPTHQGAYTAGWAPSTTGPWYFVGSRPGEIITTLDGGSGDTSYFPIVHDAGTLYGIWGLSRSDGFAVGTGALVRLVDDGGWEPVPAPSTADMRVIHGSRLLDGGQLYVAGGTGGTVWSKAGGGFFKASALPTGATLTGAWVAPTGEAWVGGTANQDSWLYVAADGGWQRELLPCDSVNGVWGFWDGGTTVWVGGLEGDILRHR